jgi:hypothetical protein
MSGLPLIATEERISRFGSFVPLAEVAVADQPTKYSLLMTKTAETRLP